METQEENLIIFQKSVSEILKTLSYSCGLSKKKAAKLSYELEENHEVDVNVIEDVGIKVVKCLQTLNGNIAVIMKALDDSVTEINNKQNGLLFRELSKELLIWKSNESNISANQTTSSKLNEVGTGNKRVGTGILTSDTGTSAIMDAIKCEESNTKNIMDMPNGPSESITTRKSICLSLNVENNSSDTQNTDDDWNDTLKLNYHDKSIRQDIKMEPNESFNCDNKEDINFEEETIQQYHVDEGEERNCAKKEDDRMEFSEIEDKTEILTNSDMEISTNVDIETTEYLLDKSKTPSPSAFIKIENSRKSKSSQSESSVDKKSPHENSNINKGTIFNPKKSIGRNEQDHVNIENRIEETDASEKTHDSINPNNSSDDVIIISEKINQNAVHSQNQIVDIDLSDVFSISSTDSKILTHNNEHRYGQEEDMNSSDSSSYNSSQAGNIEEDENDTSVSPSETIPKSVDSPKADVSDEDSNLERKLLDISSDIESENLVEKPPNEISNKVDDTPNDRPSEQVDPRDEEIYQSNDKCQNDSVSSSSTQNSIPLEDVYENPFSVETIKYNSDGEIEQNEVLDEHSYSFATSPSTVDNKLCDSESSRTVDCVSVIEFSDIHTEHNYSSPKHFSGEDNVENNTLTITNNTDSDATDIDHETQDLVLSKSQVGVTDTENSNEDNSDKVKEAGSRPENIFSQESYQSYEFDVSGNVDHSDKSDAAVDALSNAAQDKSKHNSLGFESDEINELMCNINTEEEICNQKSSGICEENHDDEQKGDFVDSQNTIIMGNETLMDVIMEEFLPVTENAQEKNDSEETVIIETYVQVKSEEPDVQIVDRNRDIGDEILSLLNEVEFPNEGEMKSIDSDDAVKAEEILMKFQGNKFHDSDSDSEKSEDSSSLSDSSLDSVETDCQTAFSGNKFAQILKEYNINDCFVQLENLELSANDVQKHKKYLEDNWEWLCDLSNIQNKRKHSAPSNGAYRKKRSESIPAELSDSASSSSSDVEIRGYRPGTPVLPRHLENKIDDILANTICKKLRNDETSESSDDSDDSVSKKKNKEKRQSNTTMTCGNNSKNVFTEEELKKRAWKNDPLLRGKLSSSSETDDSTKNSNSKRNPRRFTETSVDFKNLDSDSDTEIFKNNKSKLEDKEISPIKRNIPVSDDSDSDIEFIPPKSKTPNKSADDDFGSSQRGRRNIRALVSEEALADATKKANKEELERIERLKEREKVIETFSQSFNMSQSEEQIVTPFFLDIDDKSGEQIIQVHDNITAKLKDHQRLGIQFMWNSCYESVERLKKHHGSGCILAHCMGLGKTFQVLALVHTLFTHEETNTNHVLVVCPLSTVSNWKKEVKWAFKDMPETRMFNIFTIGTRKEISIKYEIIKKWQLREKALLVLGYEGFETLTNEAKLDKASQNSDLKTAMLKALIDPGPDLVICDEGHLLRNKKALKSQALNKIRTQRRIVLTGTPLQNNLNEYYHMVQFVKPNLLGNSKEFKTNFVNPITNGQYEDSTKEDIKLMMKRTHVLHRLLGKTVQRMEDSELERYLPKMIDHAVFIQLTQSQIDLYNHFTELTLRNRDNKNFLSDFQIFQYICTHPQLVAIMDNVNRKKIKERDLITNEDDPAVCIPKGWWKDQLPVDCESKIQYGNKLVVMKAIIEECELLGDKVLLFSQCLGELDLIEHFLKTIGTRKCASWQKKLDYYRMDGTVSPEDRTFICDKFNNPENSRIRLLLMSTKVGGLGLNLTAANRVIIMTVNWNPSYDTQSVFRVYRFGQQKPVYVYRLVSLDTMEEKVYQRGVTKLAIAHRVVDKHQITNHYQRMHLQELYTCRPNTDYERPTPNVPEDKLLAKLILWLPCIFKYHEHKALLANRPEINLSEEELSSAWQSWKDGENTPKPAPPLPPPPPSTMLPSTSQNSIQTSPDYATAYNLGRNNVNIISNQKRNALAVPTSEQSKQYLMKLNQPSGLYRPQTAKFPNPYSVQHIPLHDGPSSSISRGDPRFSAPNNQANTIPNRMRSYTGDQNKNDRLPAPAINRAPVTNETDVSTAISTDRAEMRIGYSRVSAFRNYSEAAKSSGSTIRRMNAIPIKIRKKSRENRPTTGMVSRNEHIAEIPNTNVTSESNSPSETRVVEVRQPQYKSWEPKISMVPKINQNPINILRINPENSLLASPTRLVKVQRHEIDKDANIIPLKRLVFVNTSDQNRPSTSMPTENVNVDNLKRKMDQAINEHSKKRRIIQSNVERRKSIPGEIRENVMPPKVAPNNSKKEASSLASTPLTKNMLKSLGLGGVTIRRVSEVEDVITLD